MGMKLTKAVHLRSLASLQGKGRVKEEALIRYINYASNVLEDLDLSKCSLGDKSSLSLCSVILALGDKSVLKRLDLSNNMMAGTTPDSLTAWDSNSSSLSFPSLEWVDLSKNELCTAEMPWLMDFLSRCPNLKHVNVKENFIQASGIRKMAEFLSSPTTTTTHQKLHFVGMMDNPGSDSTEGLKVLTEMVQANQHIHDVGLGGFMLYQNEYTPTIYRTKRILQYNLTCNRVGLKRIVQQHGSNHSLVPFMISAMSGKTDNDGNEDDGDEQIQSDHNGISVVFEMLRNRPDIFLSST
eukprot:CAMPEP_0116565862 /NCGR_PEP_ID=MMETSP0397-20121206/14127_1 /TAXON_ID=216820 /ORGANISM="Cyclophora tenuis, Strain ECT3854" /LENGTH=295 /DNA_ID=CAMNT_0004092669 /DNA_START=102 /DNA_END=989 /DNA_ORIENTATION=-